MELSEQQKEGRFKLRVLANIGLTIPVIWIVVDNLYMRTGLILELLFGLIVGKIISSVMIDGSGGARKLWIGFGFLFGGILARQGYVLIGNAIYPLGAMLILSGLAVWVISVITLTDKDIKAYMPKKMLLVDDDPKVEKLIDEIGRGGLKSPPNSETQ